MTYEITLDNNSNIVKILDRSVMKAEYAGGEIAEYVLEGHEHVSYRTSGIKRYRHANSSIPRIKDFLPEINIHNNLRGIYSEFEQNGKVISREWYFAFPSEEDFNNLHESLGKPLPSGELFDMFKSDPERYKYVGAPEGYAWCCSVEIKGVAVFVDWYMNVNQEEYDNIKKNFNVPANN